MAHARHGFGLLMVLLTFGLSNALAGPLLVNGAGATFPYPLYSKWFSVYQKVDPAVQFNYQSIGSGGGIRQFLEKTVDFGATDSPMTDEQLAKAGAPVLHIPTVMGAVVLTYNVPGVTGRIRLSPEVIVGIYLGKIKNWNAPEIQALNPGHPFPKDSILVTYRSDGSGTTAIFTDYLSKVSSEWKERVGAGPAVRWPVGLGGKGNEGVTGLVKQTPGSIGYVELIYAESNKLPFADVRNKAGQFVKPGPDSVSAAAAGSLKSMPRDFRTSITDAEGKGAYPIGGFTYLLVWKRMSGEKGKKIKTFLHWAMGEGQKSAAELYYAPIPKEMLGRVKAAIESIELD